MMLGGFAFGLLERIKHINFLAKGCAARGSDIGKLAFRVSCQNAAGVKAHIAYDGDGFTCTTARHSQNMTIVFYANQLVTVYDGSCAESLFRYLNNHILYGCIPGYLRNFVVGDQITHPKV